MPEPIAVVGLACLFPGARTPEAFWDNLIHSRDSRTEVTEAQLRVDPRRFLAQQKGVEDRYYCTRGGYLHDFAFDSEGFQLAAEQLSALDDVHQWPLHVAREALRDANYPEGSEALKNCGVILGNLSFPTKASNAAMLPLYQEAWEGALQELLNRPDFQLPAFGSIPEDALSADPADALGISGRPASLVARALGLSGRAYALDAACASSLYSVGLACHTLWSGQTDLMLAGAVSAADPFFVNMGFSIFQAYPESGESRPLDKHSGGLFASEGAGMFVLRRLSDALRDGQRVHAVISGVGLSNDGRGQFVLSPNPKGQKLAFERAYVSSGIPPQAVDYIECHATGTPLGDKVELNSMEAFFGAQGVTPTIGSVKSNLGHMLTAAGMGGMIKVILSLQQGKIPGTIGVEVPLVSEQGLFGGERTLRQTIDWPHDRPERTATVSAFGFGGCNAHLILQNSTPLLENSASAPRCKLPDLAVIGLEAIFGDRDGMQAVEQAFLEGQTAFRSLPETRWRGLGNPHPELQGAWLESFEIDFLRFRLPPNPKERLIPQQLLTLEVADRALRQTRLREGQNVAVLVAMETELELHRFRGRVNLSTQLEAGLAACGIELSEDQRQALEKLAKDALLEAVPVNQFTSFIGNIMASRISALWDFTGPAMTISSEETSVFKALEVSRLLLSTGGVDAVVVAAVDLSGSAESVTLRSRVFPQHVGVPGWPLGPESHGWTPGEGAGVVVVTTPEKAGKQRVHAMIEAVEFASGTASESIGQGAQKALNSLSLAPEEVGLVVLQSSGVATSDEAEWEGIRAVYPEAALAGPSAHFGHTFAASGMASLLEAICALRTRTLPPVPGWEAPKQEATWSETGLYIPTESRPWFQSGNSPRRAAVSSLGLEAAHAIVAESPSTASVKSDTGHTFLIPLNAPEASGLLRQLDQLTQDLSTGTDLSEVARRAFELQQNQSGGLALALIGESRDELLQELQAARSGVEKALQGGTDWVTPRGSCFAPKPLGPQGRVAFTYPGGFNSYIGNSRTAFRLMPELHESMRSHTSRLGALLHERRLYPRSSRRLSDAELQRQQKAFVDTPIAMFESGITTGVLHTKLMREGFGVEPDLAFGYSMGEVTMMFALGVWGSMDPMSELLGISPLFRERLCGPMHTVRDAWKLAPEEKADEPIWHWYTLRAAPEAAEALCETEERAYLILINTPQEVVIAGEAESCERVAQKLGVEAHPLHVTDVVHCAPVKADYDEVKLVHTNPVVAQPDLDFYSAVDYRPTRLETDLLGHNIAQIYGRTVDYTRLVENTYEDGARIFVDLGPRVSCAKWISETLGERPHLAVGVSRRGVDDRVQILRTLARLYSHQVPVNLERLYPELPERRVRELRQTIMMGGAPIQSINTPGNREAFRSPSPTLPAEAAAPSSPNRPPDASGTAPTEAPPQPIDPMNAPASSGSALPSDSLGDYPERLSRAHAAFLEFRQEGLRRMAALIAEQMGGGLATPEPVLTRVPPQPPATGPLAFDSPPVQQAEIGGGAGRTKPPGVVFDQQDLLEFAGGQIANVFGLEYAEIDTYRRCVRLPLDPYLLVSRVTRLNAKLGEFKPSTITTEYDIPQNAWYCTDGQIPWAVAVESGQCDLMLISYLGIDFECRGERVYRLLDCTLTYLEDMPREGETLRYDIFIDSFARSGGTLLFFFHYECFVGERMVMRMDGGCAGFFTDEELSVGQGVIRTQKEIEARQQATQLHFTPLLNCTKTRFRREELLALSTGHPEVCFGPHYAQPGRNPSLKTAPEQFLMHDRITQVDQQGGDWGCGLVLSEKDLAPDHWYFPCHFKDDPVMAGSLMAEGCVQLMQFFMLYLGLQTRTQDATFQPIHGMSQIVRCRGQVIPGDTLLTYRMEVREIGLDPIPYAIADVDILLGEKIVVDFRNLGVQLVERGSDFRLTQEWFEQHPERPALRSTQAHPEPPPAAAAGLLADDQQLWEFALGDVARCMGPDYQVYAQRPVQRNPNRDLQLLSRVRSFEGTRRRFDTPMKIIGEYEAPADAWYFRDGAHPAQMPYSVLMEIALQPCGFISAYSGAMFHYPDLDLHYRNLDGNGTLLANPDLRGKTIVSETTLKSTVASGNTVIQTHDFSLSVDGETFYVGDTVFGYFTDEALANQIGLDGGKKVKPWIAEHLPEVTLDLNRAPRWIQGPEGRPFQRLGSGQLRLLDELRIVAQGGTFGRGYVYGLRSVDPNDWFFPCHFHQDPVMPGSLGVEAILQAMQGFALQQGWTERFRNPRFSWNLSRTAWKYRGQIIPQTERMQLEAHLKEIREDAGQTVIVADASLWRDDLRIYAITDAVIEIRECGD